MYCKYHFAVMTSLINYLDIELAPRYALADDTFQRPSWHDMFFSPCSCDVKLGYLPGVSPRPSWVCEWTCGGELQLHTPCPQTPSATSVWSATWSTVIVKENWSIKLHQIIETNAVVTPLSKAASYEPGIVILGIWGDTWLTRGKYGINMAVRGSYGALTGSMWRLLPRKISPIYCRFSYVAVTRLPLLVLRNTRHYVIICYSYGELPKFVLRCSYEAALCKGVTTALIMHNHHHHHHLHHHHHHNHHNNQHLDNDILVT